MTRTDVPLPQHQGFGATSRRDAWWAQPLLVFLGLSAFVVYSTWAAFQGVEYHFSGRGANYLSPFYSPELFGDSPHAWFGPKPTWYPTWLPWSPALLILWAPAGFRFTCYYYRGAYYKAFWADPPNCAVGEPRSGYRGEHTFPLILQNIHRYFFYLALLFIVILSYDAWRGFWFADADGGERLGVRLGSIVLLVNVILLSGYTLGCHSLRHLVGGGLDRLSGRPVRKKTYDCVSCLNRGHMRWAWASLFWVGFTDFYVRMCAKGVFTDVSIIG
ncbi:MAG: succinate dehydrogenase [Phycisphaerae bacterium]|nr:succinate dehydrogenase [Phycisphaerae bacterium]NNF44325.1 succinate dehydrogenase [Phycisphaerales bacterium]